jgi:hypothetical protein
LGPGAFDVRDKGSSTARDLIGAKKSDIEQNQSPGAESEMKELRDAVVTSVGDPNVRNSLVQFIETAVANTITAASDLQLQVKQVDRERERIELQVAIEERQVLIAERRSRMRRSWFERESVASIVGAFLLLALGITLIVAMFIGVAPTEVVTSAFLLILGYFFGQAVDRRKLNADSSQQPAE